MTLTHASHDSFRWLAARVVLLSATPVALLALTVCSLLFTAYGHDAQTPFGALVRAVTAPAQSVADAMERAATAFPGATILHVADERVVQATGHAAPAPMDAEARELVASLGGPLTTSMHAGERFALRAAIPPLPGSPAMAAVSIAHGTGQDDSAAGQAIVVSMPLRLLFPQMEYAWGMTIIVSGVLVMLLLYNSLVFSGYVQQKLSSEELRRRALERRMVEANRLSSLGTLAAGIAHEINNPLSIMTQEAGWLEDLTEDGLPAAELAGKVRTAARIIHTQGARCRDITHSLLRLSRQGAVEAGAVDVNAVIEEVGTLSQHRCTTQRVALRMETDADLPPAYAAQAHVQQILLNLVGNALDAMQGREGTLTLRSRQEGEAILVTVADTGPGMSATVQSRIFEPFFTTKPAGRGTGLGLAICYGLARRNNGALGVHSTEGEGTTFTLSLPVMPSDDDMPQPGGEHRIPAMPEPQPRSEGEPA